MLLCFAGFCRVRSRLGTRDPASATHYKAGPENSNLLGAHKTRSGVEYWFYLRPLQNLFSWAGANDADLLPCVCGGIWPSIPEIKPSSRCARHYIVWRSPWNAYLDTQAVWANWRSHAETPAFTGCREGTHRRGSKQSVLGSGYQNGFVLTQHEENPTLFLLWAANAFIYHKKCCVLRPSFKSNCSFVT